MPFVDRFEAFDFSFVQRDPDLIKTHVDLYYQDPVTKETWFAPEGTVSDGGSIPRPLWSLFGHPLEGESIRAYVLHDVGYARGARSKAECDLMFYHALLEEKADKAYWKYHGVRWFGWRAWLRYRRRDKLTDV